ncbi:MAG: nickel pincer cofactor biosynthesis protein LarB [Planctomycetota bacterium]
MEGRRDHPQTPEAGSGLRSLLEDVARGRLRVEDAMTRLGSLPDVQGGLSLRLDHDRDRRCGFPEVVYGQGKELGDLVCAAREILEESGRLLVTRLDEEKGSRLAGAIEGAIHHRRARCVTAARQAVDQRGLVAVLCAGTSDIPVAEEARVTAEITGSRTESFHDVGVAGLHRLLAIREALERARAVIVVAGMEGALPSVVAGLLRHPVIAVPTSVGYGASFGGIAPLLAMLNSCATGVAVVNIDNGFGAGMLASRINLLEPLRGEGPAKGAQ